VALVAHRRRRYNPRPVRALHTFVIGSALVLGCGNVEESDDPCTPSTAGAVPRDDNGDGAIDEGCAWHVGSPHALEPTAGAPGTDPSTEANWISPDGLRLYLAATTGGGAPFRIAVASRSDRGQPFGDPVPLVGAALGNYSVGGITLSSDELEAIVSARPEPGTGSKDLYRMTRAAVTEPFGALERIAEVSTDADDERPHLRSDGEELVYASGRVLMSASREGGAFAAPVALAGLPGDSNAPYLSIDGRTMVFYHRNAGAPFRIYRAEREDADSASFGEPVELIELEPSGQSQLVHPVLSEATRELFYSDRGAWTPSHATVWRAEVCRDGACAPRTATCAGVRGPDGLHCYTRIVDRDTRAQSEEACRSLGGHLVAIESQGEQEFIKTTFGTEPVWIGGYDNRDGVAECNNAGLDGTTAGCSWAWEGGARWTFQAWASGSASTPAEPQGGAAENCAVLAPLALGAWIDTSCEGANRGVCETALYPTW
jgi:hypothetical protein